MLKWPFKDPDEVLDYQIDWSPRLIDGDIIINSIFIPDTSSGDINVDSTAFTTTSSTIWLSGGAINATYIFVNRVTTEAGRTMDQSVSIQIRPK